MTAEAELEALIRRVLREELARVMPQRARKADEPATVTVTPAVQRRARRALEERGLLGARKR